MVPGFMLFFLAIYIATLQRTWWGMILPAAVLICSLILITHAASMEERLRLHDCVEQPVEPYSLVEADEKCHVWLDQIELVGFNNGVILRNVGTQELPVSVTFSGGVTMTALLAEHGEASLVSKEALNSTLLVWLSFVTDGKKSEFDFRRCPAMSLPQSAAEKSE